MRRIVAGLLAVVLLAAAAPLEDRLRAQRPLAPEANRIGVGPLLGSVLTGAFRPLLLNYLWIRSDILYGQGRTDELHVHIQTMTTLYPNNERAREFLGWYLAYNLKQEAPDEELAWKWASSGLDVLAEIPAARAVLAGWFLKQCGQNAMAPPLRYAGEAWRAERRLRARARVWGEPRFGRAMTRFELALHALGEPDSDIAGIARTEILTHLVIDDWLRTGRSEHVAEAVRANRWTATQGLGDFFDRRLPLSYMQTANFLQDPRRYAKSDRYDYAVARWALGAHGKDAELLSLAALALVEYPEETALLARWIEYGAAGWKGAPPPLPFDGNG